MEDIFISIINYLDFLISSIKPKKRIFIAVDGVAPRAKNENQRHRRFHAAKGIHDNINFLTETLKITPGYMAFKFNSISPGTEFMYELVGHLHTYVKKKIHEDTSWRNIKVF